MENLVTLNPDIRWLPPIPTANGHSATKTSSVRDVWAGNIDVEFISIRDIILNYNYIAMDTEFPGTVVKPLGQFRNYLDYQYNVIKHNVDLLSIIQLGLTFFDEYGRRPAGISTWQFNFKFSLTQDMYARDSIDLLKRSGIQFEKHEQNGIDPLYFAELLMTSGVILMDNVKWLSFHGGYDFGYLLKVLTDTNLPNDDGEFFDLLKIYFPNIYDVKYLMNRINAMGGLAELADRLGIPCPGPLHQAGSDSLLTGIAFFKMQRAFFQGKIGEEHCNHLFGLGRSMSSGGKSIFVNVTQGVPNS